jgi:hypothetical protein
MSGSKIEGVNRVGINLEDVGSGNPWFSFKVGLLTWHV